MTRTLVEANALPQASVPDVARIGGELVLPALISRVILRRSSGMALAERFQLDRAAVRLLQNFAIDTGEDL